MPPLGGTLGPSRSRRDLFSVPAVLYRFGLPKLDYSRPDCYGVARLGTGICYQVQHNGLTLWLFILSVAIHELHYYARGRNKVGGAN